jgi:GT2 family glycosyltransferase/glycosyltransferase involved in cell wall biosynthesis
VTRQMPSQVSTRTDPPAPLKVLHVFQELRYSGGEVMMRVASGLWAQKGIECTIAAVVDVVGPYADTLESAGYRVHRLPASAPRLLSSFCRLLGSLKPDVVHLHVEQANFRLALEALAFGARVVQTVHSSLQFTGTLRIKRIIQRHLLSGFGVKYVAVAPSSSIHEWRAFHNRTEMIWNWCDLNTFKEPTDTDRDAARREFGLGAHDRVLASVGNCSPVKNHQLIIRAMAMPSMPSNAVYLHVGDDNGEAGAAERKLAARLGLGDRVRFLGMKEDVWRVYHAADIFVMPSRREGLGLAAVEAVASGTPTLVTRVPGLRDLATLTSEVEAVEDDPAALSSTAARSISHSDQGSRRMQLRATAERYFSPARGVAQCADLYRAFTRPSVDSFISVKPTTIGVLLTCHNRRQHTLACLEGLHRNVIDGVTVDVHLVDDGSSDGTAEAVAEAYPDVEITIGSGKLFWGGGMRLAFTRAVPARPDYLLWLNDDVVPDEDALKRLLVTHDALWAERQPLSLVVGATRDPRSGTTTYGGLRRISRFRRMAFAQVEPADEPQPCDTMNGNVVLVHKSIYSLIGNIDSQFTHAMGDIDYGLRARSAGCQVYLAAGHVGVCRENAHAGTYRDETLNAIERLRLAASPKGLPFREWAVLCRRHGGLLWPALALSPYVRMAMRRAR